MVAPETVWLGAAALRPLLVPLGSLVRHPRNPRRGEIPEIAASLARFGQVRPILTDGHQIIAGNHTFLAAESLGWTHVAAVANSFSSEEEARAYLLADNRLPELGDYDQIQLRSMLDEIEATGDWGGTGYQPDDLEDLRAAQNAVPTTSYEVFTGDYAASAEELAARAETLAAGNTLREVVLILTEDQSSQFEAHLRILRKEYGGSGGVTETVLRAVAEQTERA